MNKEQNFKVLVVDDEVELASIIGAHLRISGYSYSLAYSGKEALSYMMNESYDLVVCDLVMPEMDGFELLKEVRNQNIKVPFIFCSGLDESPFENEKPEGIFKFLQKPFAMNELIRSIGDCLNSANLELTTGENHR